MTLVLIIALSSATPSKISGTNWPQANAGAFFTLFGILWFNKIWTQSEDLLYEKIINNSSGKKLPIELSDHSTLKIPQGTFKELLKTATPGKPIVKLANHSRVIIGLSTPEKLLVSMAPFALLCTGLWLIGTSFAK